MNIIIIMMTNYEYELEVPVSLLLVLWLSVLGPTLFLIYINDLPQSVSCKVSLYADDTFLYAEVNNKIQQQAFQRDLNSLYSWSLKWKMPFNTNKCEVIIFVKVDDTSHLYSLGDTTLRTVKEAKYLGVIMQSNLKFDRHIISKVNNVRKILGLSSIRSTTHTWRQN